MKRLFLFLLPLFGIQPLVHATDTTRVRVSDISYHSLDSLIHTREYTGIYYWPAWCSGCRVKVPAVVELLAQKKNITLISVNDPDSRPFLPQWLVNRQVVKGYYRIERHGREKLITINDVTQFKYFHWYFTRETCKYEARQNQYFLLFDRTGKLLYHNKSDFNVDSIKVAIAGYP
jgi:hypothetical protein